MAGPFNARLRAVDLFAYYSVIAKTIWNSGLSLGTDMNTLSDVQSLNSIWLCHFYTFIVVVIIMDVLGG